MTDFIKSFDEIADSFSETRQNSWPEFEIVVKNIKEGDSVCDIGCGNGRFYSFLKNIFSNINYHGVDISEKLVSIAKNTYGNSLFERADMSHYKRPKTYDHIISIAAFHHLQTHDERVQTIKNWSESLKEGGEIIVIVWNLFQKKYKKYIWESLWGACLGRGRFRDAYIPWKRDGAMIRRYYHAFTRRELIRLFRKNGLFVDVCSYTDEKGCTKNKSLARNILIIARKR